MSDSAFHGVCRAHANWSTLKFFKSCLALCSSYSQQVSSRIGKPPPNGNHQQYTVTSIQHVLTSSNMIHSPRFIALRKGPSLQVNLTVVLVSSGRSQPNSSDRSCRDGHTDHLCMPHQHVHTAYIQYTYCIHT